MGRITSWEQSALCGRVVWKTSYFFCLLKSVLCVSPGCKTTFTFGIIELKMKLTCYQREHLAGFKPWYVIVTLILPPLCNCGEQITGEVIDNHYLIALMLLVPLCLKIKTTFCLMQVLIGDFAFLLLFIFYKNSPEFNRHWGRLTIILSMPNILMSQNQSGNDLFWEKKTFLSSSSKQTFFL